MLALFLCTASLAQEKNRPASAKPAPSAKAASAVPETNSEQSQATPRFSTRNPQHEDSEQVKRRELWFYKQRADSLGHIPASARLKAFQHMQRMMEAEGKIVRRPDGTIEAVAPQVGSVVGGAWTALGPTPTSGGFFSPVSGRVTTIAVDPSDMSGNTVLVGGAQGGIWRSTDGGTTWTPTGDMNPSLAMGSIAFAPSSPTTVYAGTGEQASLGFDIYYGAGVLKSTNGGLTWTQTCTVASATCPFIGPFTNTLNFGFFNDGGARISYIAVNPSNANLVLVGAQIPRAGTSPSETAGGIYCSDDAGATWHSLLLGGAGSSVGFANATTAYAAIGRPLGSTTGSANGVYKSTNASGTCSAITFAPTATQPTTSAMGRIDLGIFDANTVYASVANGAAGSSTNVGVFVTTNGGSTWSSTAAPDICQQQCWYDNVVKVDPSNSSIVFFGGSAVGPPNAFEWVVRSTNGGTTFSPAIPTPNFSIPGLPHVDQHAMALFKATTGTFANKVRMYLGNDGGVWRTDDAEAATVTWTNVNQNLTLSQFYPGLSFNSANPSLLYAGTQDNGSQFTQGSINWTDNNQCGDGGYTATDFLVPTVVYVDCQDINLFMSPTGGTDSTSFVPIGIGINFADHVDFIPPLATDPSTAGRVYFGTDKVYQSNDFGNSWTAISGVLPTSAGAVLTALGVSPNNPAVVYAGADTGEVFVTTNATAASPSFAQVGVNQLPLRNVTALVVDPADATGSTAYAVFSGFAVGTDTKGHIFKTVNAGAAWTDVSCTVANCATPALTDLPNIPMNDLVVDPDVPGTVYAASDVGIFQGSACTAAACTWNTLGTGFPNVASLSLKLYEPSRLLVASTHGRGVWSLALTNFTFVGPHVSSLSPVSIQAPAASPLTLTVNGSTLTGGTVQWKANGTTTPLATTQVSGTQLTASVPTSLLASGGTAQVSVTAGASTSNSLIFSVLGGAPTLTSITPNSTPVQTPNPTMAVTVMLTGTGFIASSKVALNGSQTGITVAAPTSSCALPTCLSATLAASLLGPFGSTNDMTVVNPPPGGGSSAALTFKVVAPPPPNDNFANAINATLTSNMFTDTQDSSGATVETGEPSPPCIGPILGNLNPGLFNTIWYKFTATSSGTLNVDTIGSSYDTTLATFTGSAVNALTAVPVACNDDINPGIILQSRIIFTAAAGTTYFFQVGSFGTGDPNPLAFGGKAVFNLAFTATPDFTITTSGTTSQTVSAGATATYSNVLSITAQNGFSGAVNLSCSLPTAATATTCAVSPVSLTPGGGSASVTVTTTSRAAIPPVGFNRPRGPVGRLLPVALLAMFVLFLLAWAARTKRQRLAFSLVLGVMGVALLLHVAGCGSGSSSSGPPPPHGTPAGTYTVTVTGTSGNTTHTAPLTLVVN